MMVLLLIDGEAESVCWLQLTGSQQRQQFLHFVGPSVSRGLGSRLLSSNCRTSSKDLPACSSCLCVAPS